MDAIVVIPDLQVPYQDNKFVAALANFIDHFRPTKVVQVGDLMDQPQPSHWNKGLAGEYERTLQKDLDLTKNIIQALRIEEMIMGNHDERIETYVNRFAPALSSLGCLEYDRLLELGYRGITLHRKPVEVAPGWILAHGHEGSLNSIAGRTAFGLAKRYDRSVVCGHTHRAGLASETVGISGKSRVISGLEVGHGMDLKHATYVKSPNWQQAFGILYVEGRLVQPHLVPVHNGRFIFEGKEFKDPGRIRL